MIWIDLRDICAGFGGPLLLENVNLQIQENEKVALIGRNGQGKSTLIRIILGESEVDKGEIQRSQGIHMASLTQQVPQQLVGPVFDILAQGLGEVGIAISEYNRISHHLINDSDNDLLEQAQQKLDDNGGWEEIQRIEEIASRLILDLNEQFENLSAGKKRRVLLARALVKKPDLLLLDEPTNHLDLASIQWLEEFFARYSGAVLFVTHDRSFLKKIATRIIELENGRLTSWECDYENFLTRKEDLANAEEKHQQLFDKRMAQEEVWIRTGIRARRTRNEGRVRRLKAMREEHRQRRKKIGSVKLMAQQAEKSGNLVIHAENIGFSYDKAIVSDFSTTIMRGDKFGIIGPNGCGKTTLLKLLLGELPPQQGKLKHGTNLQIAYFDQLRNKLDRDKTIFENLGEGNDTVMINGRKKHVIGYMQDFLFAARDANNQVWTLSGGEQNRLLLAKLFLRPSNVLVLDEPTNDLDIETLELLEQLLVDYPGTVFLVSHDRTFLNNVVTNSLVFENGAINEYVGGYDDWLAQRPEEPKKVKKVSYPKKQRAKKLSFREKQELEQLPLTIEELEEEQQQLYDQMADPTFYQQSDKVAEVQKRSQQIAEDLETAYARWEELENLA